LHTGNKILVGQANCSQAVRRHGFDDIADKQDPIGIRKPLNFTTSAENPAASDNKNYSISVSPGTLHLIPF